MILKNKETINDFIVESYVFKTYLSDKVNEFEFISGTKEEKKLFNSISEKNKVKNASDEDLEAMLIGEG